MTSIDVARAGLAVFLVFAGVMHFVAPRFFLRMMPPALPAHRLLVAASGACELGLGVALLIAQTRPWSAYAVIALFIAVFPANVHMALHRISFGRRPTPTWVLWARLPLQGVLIAWAWLVR